MCATKQATFAQSLSQNSDSGAAAALGAQSASKKQKLSATEDDNSEEIRVTKRSKVEEKKNKDSSAKHNVVEVL